MMSHVVLQGMGDVIGIAEVEFSHVHSKKQALIPAQ